MRKTGFIKHLEQCKLSILDEAYFKCSTNPDIVNMGTAENKLMNDYLLPYIQDRSDMTMYHTTYGASFNPKDLQEAVASLYEAHFGIKDVKRENIVVSVGIALIVERLSLVLCVPGDVILLPKPCYGCFEPDMFVSGAKIEYIDLKNLPEKPPERAKLMILTNPGNPLGELIEDPESILKWAYQVPDLHIVTDDIYGLTNREGKPFQSIMGMECADPFKVHHVYGLSKDWGMAGFHVGFFYTRNDELRDMLKLAHGCCHTPSDTKWVITKVLGDIEFREKYIKVWKERLAAAEKITCEVLTQAGIEFKTAPNSLFVMADLRKIAGASRENEIDVWRTLIDKYKVHIAPGAEGFHCDEFGWFRICFSMEEEVLREGLSRVVSCYKALMQ